MTTRTHRAVRTNEDMLVYQEAEQDDFALELDNEAGQQASTARIVRMAQLIVASREYQFA